MNIEVFDVNDTKPELANGSRRSNAYKELHEAILNMVEQGQPMLAITVDEDRINGIRSSLTGLRKKGYDVSTTMAKDGRLVILNNQA